MKKLYFVRHGQSQDNLSDVWSRYDTPLTEKGRGQAKTTGQNIKQKGLAFDIIIASPLPRAHETARIIASEIGHPKDKLELLDTLVERDWGPLAGTSGKQFFDGTRIYKDMDNLEGMETLAEMHKRVQQSLEYVKNRPEERILIVGHGSFGRTLRRVVNGEPYTLEYATDFPTGRIENAEIVELI